MKNLASFIVRRVVAGLVVVAPVYLAILLVLKGMKSLLGLLAPVAKALPKSAPAQNVVALILLLIICFFVGLAIRTATGRTIRNHLDKSFFQKIPGYSLLRSLTQRLAGETKDETWHAALVEIEEALVPAFIIEELDDGRFTVFVPSIPTPMAGAVYILTADRVHPVEVPFTQAVTTISKWGAGCKNLVAAMKERETTMNSS